MAFGAHSAHVPWYPCAPANGSSQQHPCSSSQKNLSVNKLQLAIGSAVVMGAVVVFASVVPLL